MTRSFLAKTSFTAGELDPLLAGRVDLRAQEEGAARLRNVVVHPSGGVSRRPGLAYLATVPGARRILAFDSGEGDELLVFGAFTLEVRRHGELLAGPIGTLWDLDEVDQLSWARWGNRLFLCHPLVPTQELIRWDALTWQLRAWTFETDRQGTYDRPLMPFTKFVGADTVLQIGDGSDLPISASASPVVSLVASEPVFTAQHGGVILRYKDRDLRIISWDPLNPERALAQPLQDLPDGKPTRNWAEQAFSGARGWPANVAIHQERLIIGGSRDLPDRLWLSRTARPLNFDPGQGLDDEAFSFALGGDEHHRIVSVTAGRHLQLFTTAGEWIVRGTPLTPGTVQTELQTRVGSWVERTVRPVDVDGATLFIGASGRELREFLFADSEQAYQAADIALLSRHLLDRPASMLFDRRQRRLLVLREDGRMASVTIDRNSNVVAWSLIETRGAIRSAAALDGRIYCLVELNGTTLLDRFDEEMPLDHGVELAAAAPTASWSGLEHLEGEAVMILRADGEPERAVVSAGAVASSAPATWVRVGTPFTHEVEPLVGAVPGARGSRLDHPYRPVRVVLRLLATRALRVDTGAGLLPVPLPASVASGQPGDVAIRASGWRRAMTQPPWRVRQDDPAPCTILAVTTEIKGNE